jgi:hypothetical protein
MWYASEVSATGLSFVQELNRAPAAIGGAPDGLLTGAPADFGKIVAFLCSEPAGFVSGAASRWCSVGTRPSLVGESGLRQGLFLQHPLTAADWAGLSARPDISRPLTPRSGGR